MDPNIIAALVGGIAGLSILGAERGWEYWDKRRERSTEINARHLNPVRLYCEETYCRLREIHQQASQQEGRCDILLSVDTVQSISAQKAEWFNSYGAYLVSTSYFTACLLGAMKKIREDIPYLKLRSGDDTALLSRTFAVSQAFLSNLGIFYAIQHSIGTEMWHREESRFLSYREFCQLLMVPEHRVWFDRLFQFYLEVGRGERQGNILQAQAALRELGLFTDRAAQGNDSIAARLSAEDIGKR